MKKILIVTDVWNPVVNGLVRVQNTLKSHLETQGHEVEAIEPESIPNVSMPFFPEIKLAISPRRHITETIDKFKPDEIIIMTGGPIGWTTRSVCKAKNIPFSTWYHTNMHLYVGMRIPFLKHCMFSFLRYFHSAAKLTIVSSQSLYTELNGQGFKNLVFVPLGVDVEVFKRNENPPRPALPGPVFIFFGRLAPEKSPDDFFELDLPGSKLVIGDGPERKRLETKYGHTCHFVGNQHGQDLVNWLSLADVLVFTSRTDTFGLVIPESLACGIPVAAHDVMGPRDVLTHGKDGYFSEDLKEAALQCLNYSRSDCRAKALKFSWEHTVDSLLLNVATQGKPAENSLSNMPANLSPQ
jgi:glycosyltransferase involved in cell wall biosynthesis